MLTNKDIKEISKSYLERVSSREYCGDVIPSYLVKDFVRDIEKAIADKRNSKNKISYGTDLRDWWNSLDKHFEDIVLSDDGMSFEEWWEKEYPLYKIDTQ